VLDWAFNEGGFDRLLARIKKENVGSIKSFEALGFEYTGDEMEEAHGQTLQWRHYEMTKEHWLDEAKKKGIDVSQFGA
jgi:RimJ/RimL family protein N-acetyltransferase